MPEGDQNQGGTQTGGQNQGGQQQQQPPQGGGGQQQQPPAGGQQQQPPQGAPLTWEQLKGQIPTDYAKDKMWESVKDIPTLLKNYAEGQRYALGAVKIPKEGAGQAEWDAYYAKLGRPASADGYEFELDTAVPWDENLVGEFKKWAHGAGLSAKQAQAVMNGYGGLFKGQVQERVNARKAVMDVLKTDIGPGYEKELAYGQAAVKQLGGEKVIAAINETGIGNNPDFVKMMIQIGRQLGEDSIIDVESIRNSERDAQTQIDEIMRNPKHAYFNRNDPGHDRAIQEVNRLFGMIHPGTVGGQAIRA